ncbi:MAG: RidA family protein [Rhodobacter sp.]|nr:RidA family protein [Rhodobacter sp.]
MPPLTPSDIAPPFARYSHGFAVPPGSRLILTSGQLGQRADGVIPPSVEEQSAICFSNIDAILAAGGASAADTVKINAFVTDREFFAGYMAARDRWLAASGVRPASTLLIVGGFTRPEFLVEVEVIAAVAGSDTSPSRGSGG